MTQVHQERRGRRYPLKLPIVISPATNQPAVMGTTRNVSRSGMFFYTDFRFKPLSTFECYLILPDDIAPLENRMLACSCKVVRVEDGVDTFGVAAKFDKIAFGGECWDVTRSSPGA
jgi:PilZ domain